MVFPHNSPPWIAEFDKLPPELILYILDKLDLIEQRRLLQNFRMVNKALYIFAESLLYRNLVLHASSAKELKSHIAKTKDLAKKSLSGRYLIQARSVKVWDSETSSLVGGDMWKNASRDQKNKIGYRRQWVQEFENISAKQNRATPEDKNWLDAWEKLAHVLSLFENIEDLIWVCQKRLPPCVLKTIQERHPRCKLHLRTFQPRTVSEIGIDNALDLMLIESENLHSVTIKLPYTNHPNTSAESKLVSNQLEIAALQLVDTAPQIQHVNIVTGFEKSRGVLGPSYISTIQRSREMLWKPKQKPKKQTHQQTQQKRKLISLVFHRWRLMHFNDIYEWSMCVDLSCIRKLILGHVSDFRVLDHLTESVRSFSLDTFGITLNETTRHEALLNSLKNLVSKLSNLEDLRLAGYHLSHHLLDEILLDRGAGLRRLEFCPTSVFSSSTIKVIEDRCPQLKFLKLTVRGTGKKLSFDDVCPVITTLQELSLLLINVTGLFEAKTLGHMEKTGLSKRKGLRGVRIINYDKIRYLHVDTEKLTASEPVFDPREGAPCAWMIDTELSDVFHNVPTAKFREGEPVLSKS